LGRRNLWRTWKWIISRLIDSCLSCIQRASRYCWHFLWRTSFLFIIKGGKTYELWKRSSWSDWLKNS
jgi:hypothetical protein